MRFLATEFVGNAYRPLVLTDTLVSGNVEDFATVAVGEVDGDSGEVVRPDGIHGLVTWNTYLSILFYSPPHLIYEVLGTAFFPEHPNGTDNQVLEVFLFQDFPFDHFLLPAVPVNGKGFVARLVGDLTCPLEHVGT